MTNKDLFDAMQASGHLVLCHIGERTKLNGYVCLFAGKRFECRAETSYQAQQKAIEHFKPAKSRRHLVSVVLAEKNGKQVTHAPID